MTLPPLSPLARHWRLDPGTCFLNHGSFGACPIAVQQAQDGFRARMEAEPVRFFVEELSGLLDAAREALARFVNVPGAARGAAGGAPVAFVPNVTSAVATVMANTPLSPGDEVLVNRHEYPACRNNIERTCTRAGARMVAADTPFPLRSPGEAIEAILSRVTSRTRLVLLSHVTSPTALVLPVAEIVAELNRRGIDSLVDGAHAPGFVPVDLAAMAPTYYTANCHKWLCAPKGTAMLYVREDRRRGFRPLVLSNMANLPRPERDHFLVEFDYVGTDDYTGAMAIPACIEHLAEIGGGWGALRDRNRGLAIRARDVLCKALGVEAPAPDEMLGAMATVPLPAHPAELGERLARRPTRYHDALQDALLERWKIQVPIFTVTGGPRSVRISAQLYNSPEQYEHLTAALLAELERERGG